MMVGGSALRVGLVGAGWMGLTHGQAWVENAPRAELVAVADASDARARALSDRATGGRARTYPDIEAMLSDAKLDAVDICLPHHLHKDAIVAAACAGKHVLCEKPLCLTLEEAKTIREAIDRGGIVFMGAHNKLFTPAMIEARRLLADGAIGQVFVVRTVEVGYNEDLKSGTPPADLAPGESSWSWRIDPAKNGGGEVLDYGWHGAYSLLALAGSRPIQVSAMLADYYINRPGVEDTGALLVRFENGATGIILTSWAFSDPPPSYEFQVSGERGSLAGSATRLVVGRHGHPPLDHTFHRVSRVAQSRTLLQSVARRVGVAGAPPTQKHPLAYSFAGEISHFLDVVQNGVPNVASWSEAARTLQLIRGAYQAAAEGCTVSLPDDPTELVTREVMAA